MSKHTSSAVYGLGFIGAAIFYIKNAANVRSRRSWISQSPCLARDAGLQIAGVFALRAKQHINWIKLKIWRLGNGYLKTSAFGDGYYQSLYLGLGFFWVF